MTSNLDDSYSLTQDQIISYRRDGHVLLRGVASPEDIAYYRPLLGKAVDNFKTEARPLEERDTYGKAFLQIINLWRRDKFIEKFVLAKRFGKIAADLMGVEGVRLYHDQALYKEPGGGITPWHQDEYYWPLDTDHTITMWMPLVDVTEKEGPMVFATGSHREKYLGALEISDKSEKFFNEFVDKKGYPRSAAAPMKAGDATFHSGWTLHGALPNKSGTSREVMTIIYYADGVKILKPDNAGRENDLKGFFPGGVPGQPAEGPLTPLVYQR
jgi:ectoine hydroxylase-related dioxygenase (phytanoyl-CoA dioxygenase family)